MNSIFLYFLNSYFTVKNLFNSLLYKLYNFSFFKIISSNNLIVNIIKLLAYY